MNRNLSIVLVFDEIIDYTPGGRVIPVATVDIAGMIECISVEDRVKVRTFLPDSLKYWLGILSQLIFAGIAPAKIDATLSGELPDVRFRCEEMLRPALMA